MIEEREGVFRLTTRNTSYWFRISPFGHLEHIHYGPRLRDQPAEGLTLKRTALPGSLEVTLQDKSNQVVLQMFYTVFEKADVIARRVVLENRNDSGNPLVVRRLMSLMLDLPNRNFKMVTLDGGWIKEANRHDHPLAYGIHVNSSTSGASSNRHNPGFLLAEADATEQHGLVYGFNLIYSGNHFSAVELANHDLVRVQTGINPHCFEWTLGKGERFETPEAVMTCSADGFNGMSRYFHDFINGHIVRGDWKGRERPILLNNWEAHFFQFT